MSTLNLMVIFHLSTAKRQTNRQLALMNVGGVCTRKRVLKEISGNHDYCYRLRHISGNNESFVAKHQNCSLAKTRKKTYTKKRYAF